MQENKPGDIIPLEGIKTVLLDIMSDLDMFCREKGLRYSLAYGSLLGAVRHKGFIPWDDDIDILMPRSDYLKLLSEYSHPYYEIKCQEKDPYFPLHFAKLCDTRTVSIDKDGNQSAIAVDIFILDGLGSSLTGAKATVRMVNRMHRIWSNQLFTGKLSPDKAFGLKKNCFILAAKAFRPLFSLPRFVKRMLKYKQRFDIDQSKYCASLTGVCTIYETARMLKYIDSPFENKKFRIQEDYNYELKIIFGDYMQLPPEEKRVITHGSTAYWV